MWGLYCGLDSALFFYIKCLTLQHFHCHFNAGLGMRESVRGGLHHPAKGSWSKSATWNTEKGSVGRGVNAAHGRPERGKEKPFCFVEILIQTNVIFRKPGLENWLEQRSDRSASARPWEFSRLCGAADRQQHILNNKSCKKVFAMSGIRAKKWRLTNVV